MARALLVTPVLLVARTPSVHAEPLFSASFLSLDGGDWPQWVAMADLNADGAPDMLVANDRNTVSSPFAVLLGRGDGTFETKTEFAIEGSVTSVAVADLNADGRPDLAVANYAYPYIGRVSVLLGNGDGTFGAKSDFETGSFPSSMAIADLNADGHQDLAVTIQFSDTVSVLLGNGDGTFEATTDFGTGNTPVSTAIADLNADGCLDLVTANYNSNTVSVLLGNGDGTFAAKIDLGTRGGSFTVAIADLNADGRLDLVTADFESSTVSVLLGHGDGTFAPTTDVGTASHPISVAIADFDTDGVRDLVVAGRLGVTVLFGNGDGSFGARNDLAIGSSSMAIADVNGDGRSDLAVVIPGSDWFPQPSVTVLLGNGDGTFGGSNNSFATGPVPRSVVIADLNLDGRMDLATANSSNTISVLLGNGDGSFGAKTDFESGISPAFLAISDLNADARPDLVATNYDSNTVSVLLGHGDGTFGAKSEFGIGAGATSVAIADLNADGRPDLAVANYAYPGIGRVSVMLGHGDGTFGAKTDFGIGSYPSSVAIADLNADGRPDVATANEGANTVSVLLGNGNGTFRTGTDFGTGGHSVSVAIADLNADGRPDLAVANAGDYPSYRSTVSVLLGNGDGTFASSTGFSAGYYTGSLAIADLNADGRSDVVVANASYIRSVSVLLGNGDGGFAARTGFGTWGDSSSVAVADLNADGWPDLAVPNSGSNSVSILLNRRATPPPIAMGFDLSPSTLNLASHGHWVTAYLEPVSPFAASDVDIASIRLDGTVPVDAAAPAALGDHDGNGVPDLLVKFSRAAVELTVSEGDDIAITVTGTVDDHSFLGTDHIRVRRAAVSVPAAGSHPTAGPLTEVSAKSLLRRRHAFRPK